MTNSTGNVVSGESMNLGPRTILSFGLRRGPITAVNTTSVTDIMQIYTVRDSS